MSELTLVIGNRNYSSWSLRAWLALRMSGLQFREIAIQLDTPETRSRILEHSPGGLVPVLRNGSLAVWESLAICEYVAELAPKAQLWPADPAARALARSVSCEMHSGFRALRNALPMNVRADRPGVKIGDDVRADIDRIAAIWRDCRAHFGSGGPFLFGRFSIADAMYAPVATRFTTYRIPLGPVEQAWVDAVRALPPMRDWAVAAKAEPWRIPHEEVGEPA